MIQLRDDWRSLDFKKIVSLYHSVGWSSYTNDEAKLLTAFQNSSYVAVALNGEALVGGRKLVEASLERYSNVRTHMLLTDNEEKQLQFYKACGYTNLKEFQGGSLNSFIKMDKL